MRGVKERRSELGHTLPATTFHALVHEKPPVGLGADYATIEKLIRDDPEAVEMLREAAGEMRQGVSGTLRFRAGAGGLPET